MKILNEEKMLAVRIAGYIILKWSGCVNKHNKGRDSGYKDIHNGQACQQDGPEQSGKSV